MIEEWRGGLGAGSRLRDQQIPVLYYKSKYAERLPIGKPEILKSFTPDRLRAVLHEMVSPRSHGPRRRRRHRSAAMLERLIKDEFGALQGRPRRRPSRDLRRAAAAELLIKVATDPEAHAVICLAGAEAHRGCRRTGRATTGATWCTGSCSR